MLVKLGADVNAKDDEKNTPIKKFMEMVRHVTRGIWSL